MKFSAGFVALSLVAIGIKAHRLPSRYARQRRGEQFVTGPCRADSDCQQGCCGFSSGKCAGPAVAQSNGSGGCGFGTAAPNCNVAAALGLSDCIAGAVNGDLTDPSVQSAAAFVANLDNLPFTPFVNSNASQSGTVVNSSVFATSTAPPPGVVVLHSVSTTAIASPLPPLHLSQFIAYGVSRTASPGASTTFVASPPPPILELPPQQASASGTNRPQTSSTFLFPPNPSVEFTPQPSSVSSTATPPSSTAVAGPPPPHFPAQLFKLVVSATCTADSDCQQGCCGFTTGKCDLPDGAQFNGAGGCGHGNTLPNCNVASAFLSSSCIAGAAPPNTTDPEVQAAIAFVAHLPVPPTK